MTVKARAGLFEIRTSGITTHRPLKIVLTNPQVLEYLVNAKICLSAQMMFAQIWTNSIKLKE